MQQLRIRCGDCERARPGIQPTLVAVGAVHNGDVTVSGVHRESKTAAAARSGVGGQGRRTLLIAAAPFNGAGWRVRCRRCGAEFEFTRAEVAAAVDAGFDELMAEPVR